MPLRGVLKATTIAVLVLGLAACSQSATSPTTVDSAPPSTAAATTAPPATVQPNTTLGTTTTTQAVVTAEEEAEAELAAARQAVRESSCPTFNVAAEVVGTVGRDPGFDDAGVIVTGSGALDRLVMTGQLFDSRVDAQAFTLETDEQLVTAQALLVFNHHRTTQIFAGYLYLGIPMEFHAREELLADTGDVVATWDGVAILLPGQEPFEFMANALSPEIQIEGTVGEDAAELAHDRIDAWLDETRSGLAEPRGVVTLEPAVTELPEVRELLCVLFATEWAASEEAISGHGDDLEWLDANADLFHNEMKTHELMLVAEYLEVMFSYLDDPEVDWFRADGVDLSQAVDGTTSATEYVELWRYGAADALARYDGMWG